MNLVGTDERKGYYERIGIFIHRHILMAYQPVTFDDVLQTYFCRFFYRLLGLQIIGNYDAVIVADM
jgi:hypothetical protein